MMTIVAVFVAIAIAAAAAVVIAVSLARKETFAETVQTKYEKYVAMLKARVRDSRFPDPAPKSEVLAALRRIHESEATRVRNPNAKRLHNAAIQRIGDGVSIAYGATAFMPKSGLAAAL
jgi:hypothetical protein